MFLMFTGYIIVKYAITYLIRTGQLKFIKKGQECEGSYKYTGDNSYDAYPVLYPILIYFCWFAKQQYATVKRNQNGQCHRYPFHLPVSHKKFILGFLFGSSECIIDAYTTGD